jgi:pimeloyl-ACP methyl ester carboxylesterase
MSGDRFTVRSIDNVEISVQKSGAGPALLLVHGAMLNAVLTWSMVLPELNKHFTVYMMDRRGRAPSGDAPQYSIALEAEDIARVAEAIGEPVRILGHSYGALSAIEGMDRLRSVKQLILYEPPGMAPSGDSRKGVVERMEQALAANDREEVATVFLRNQIGAPDEIIAGMKFSPIWPIILQISPTLPRESRAVNSYPASADRLAQWKVPTVLLLGSETKGHLKDSAAFVMKNLPGCRLEVLEGQGHTAMMQAPELFADKIIAIA